MSNTNLGMEQVTRYLKLLDRRMYIVMHSGVDWKPEYGKELDDIDKELSGLRELMDFDQDTAHDHDDQQNPDPDQDGQKGSDPGHDTGNDPGLCKSGDPGLVSHYDYIISKISFFSLHGDRFSFTANYDHVQGTFFRGYSFSDGSVWYEHVSSAISAESSFFRIEFQDSSDFVSRHFFYEVKGVLS